MDNQPKKEIARIEIVLFSNNNKQINAPTNYFLAQQMLIDAMAALLENKVKSMRASKKSIVVPNFVPPKNIVGGN